MKFVPSEVLLTQSEVCPSGKLLPLFISVTIRLPCVRGAPLKAVRGCLCPQTIPQSPSVPAPFAQGSLIRRYLYKPQRQRSCQFTHRRCDSRRKPIHAQRAIHFTTVAFFPSPVRADISAESVSPSSPPQSISRRTLRATSRG